MARAFIEFIHSQDVEWQPAPDIHGAEWKLLSSDPETRGFTALVRVPGGWRGAVGGDALSAEFFVLDGCVESQGGAAFGRHHYLYEPAGTGRQLEARSPTTFILFRDPPPAGDDAPVSIDSVAQPWDRTGLEGEIAHLNYARKNLRFAPDGKCRTYLLGGMPHGYPAQGARLERHPHDEEMFLISGDMPCSLGIMTAGAYFYRPANIEHGLDCTLNGFLMIMRTPGSNVTISEWTPELSPVALDPAHAPEVPIDHEAHGAAPRSLVPNY